MGNQDYYKKLFWGAVEVVVKRADICGIVRPLIVARNKKIVSPIDENVKTFKV